MIRLILSIFILLFLCDSIHGQRISHTTKEDIQMIQMGNGILQMPKDRMINIRSKETKSHQLKSAPINNCGNYAFTPEMLAQQEKTGEFIVNYSGFSAEAMAAFQHAVDIWSRLITTTVPIEIDASFAPLGFGILGSAGATYIDRDFSGATMSATYYPIAISDQAAGFDQLGTDIIAEFNSNFSDWYFGLDGCPPAGSYDFVTVVLHEIGHGLGIFGSEDAFYYPFPPDQGYYGCYGFEDNGVFYPVIFDKYVEFPNGIPITDYDPFFCWTDLYDLYTGDNMYFNSPEMSTCLGERARLYAPSLFQFGSSYSHLDESIYDASSPHALMTPFIGDGEAIHDVGCIIGMLRDFGYDAHDFIPLPAADPIPTIGQWGIICLSLFLLILIVIGYTPVISY